MIRPKLTPPIAYNLAKRLYEASGECDTRLESVIAQNPRLAYAYAMEILKGRFPKGEPRIVQDGGWAYLYAKDVLQGPFPEAEPVIAQDPDYARWYIEDVLKTPEDIARFKEVRRWFAPS
jgi:hypothetical protein